MPFQEIMTSLMQLFSSLGIRPNFDKGLQAYEREEFAKALGIWRPLADKGDARAQLKIGAMYKSGIGVPEDFEEALKWYRLAAEQGFSAAQVNLGAMYARGQSIPRDYQEARNWWLIAVEREDSTPDQESLMDSLGVRMITFAKERACFNLGELYEHGHGVPQDYQEALKWYKAGSGRGFTDFKAGLMYYDGRGVPQNYEKAMQWWRSAAQDFHSDAQFNLGHMYAQGCGVPQDDEEAVKWWLLAAEQGDDAAKDAADNL